MALKPERHPTPIIPPWDEPVPAKHAVVGPPPTDATSMHLCAPVHYASIAARRLELSVEHLDPHSGYLCRVSSPRGSVLIGGGSVNAWPLNCATASSVATDKGFTHLILEGLGIPTLPSTTIFLTPGFRELRAEGRELEDLPTLAQQFGWPLIAKPNNASRGSHVKLCADLAELHTHLTSMAHRYDVALLQQYAPGKEYRVFVFDGEAIFSYSKRPSALVGDGSRTVRQLLERHNELLTRVGLDQERVDSSLLLASLRSTNLHLEDIPAAGQRLNVGIRANVIAGGELTEFTTEVPEELAKLAIDATAALGLVVAGVDVIEPERSTLLAPRVVLEMNGNPALSSLKQAGREDIAVELYERTLKRLLFDAQSG